MQFCSHMHCFIDKFPITSEHALSLCEGCDNHLWWCLSCLNFNKDTPLAVQYCAALTSCMPCLHAARGLQLFIIIGGVKLLLQMPTYSLNSDPCPKRAIDWIKLRDKGILITLANYVNTYTCLWLVRLIQLNSKFPAPNSCQWWFQLHVYKACHTTYKCSFS